MSIKANPPSCISTNITIWPKKLQCVAVSRTVNPVQLSAEEAVNRASVKETDSPESLARGSQSNRVPKSIIAAKAKMKTTKKGGFFGKYSPMIGSSGGCFPEEVAFLIPAILFPSEPLGEDVFFPRPSFFGLRLVDLGVEFSFAFMC